MRHWLATSLVLCLLPSVVVAENRINKLWKYSVMALAASNIADAAASAGRYETNPVLGRGPFGGRAVAIKAGISFANIAVQRMILKHHAAASKPAAAINFGMAAVVGSIAIRNTTQPQFARNTPPGQ